MWLRAFLSQFRVLLDVFTEHLALQLLSAPWLSALACCQHFNSSSCVHHAVVNLTTRREDVRFSVWQCRLYVHRPTRLGVFSYGSLIFRFDSESSISLRVMPGLVFRLQGIRACLCFTESNLPMAPFVSFTGTSGSMSRCPVVR